MIAHIGACAVYGVQAHPVTVEVDVSTQGKGVYVVGLPDNAVKEALQRVESAVRTMGLRMPRGKVTINLAPADVRKEGAAYDLSIALAMLIGDGQLRTTALDDYLVMGELALDGTLRPIRGTLPIALEAQRQGRRGILLPESNAEEAAAVQGLEVIGCTSLRQAIDFLEGRLTIEPLHRPLEALFGDSGAGMAGPCFSSVQGQENIKRALEIAAAGGHNVIMIGPPGSGKTMLAKSLPGILPPLTLEEAMETTKIHSVAGRLTRAQALVRERPFRSPHHTISDVALVGGGNHPQPGEISLAHNGVLFLDELPEFKRTVLEVMRQPLEDRRVTISRARVSVEFPTSFMLVASMNPCPCGYYNHPERTCHCPPQMVQRYLNRVSGPLLDRIDLHVEVTPVNLEAITSGRRAEPSADIRERVVRARARQRERFAAAVASPDGETPAPALPPTTYANAMMTPDQTRAHCALDETGRQLIKTAMERLGLSARAYDRILKVSRTIADLDGADRIETPHLAEAIQYRSLDRASWGER